MTDNRTTELRVKLTERGVDYEVKDLSDIKFFHDTRWNANGVHWCYTEFVGATTCLTMCNEWKDCTPEQAIAATLGSEREKALEKLVRIYGEISNYFCERFACCDAEFVNCKYCIGLPQGGQCELGWCNDESKALGIEQPDYGGGECEPVNLEELYDRISELENECATHGTLTAEQVRDAVLENFEETHETRYDHWEPSKFDWQAIADELNAKLGSGTCEVVGDYYSDDDYMLRLSCGHSVHWPAPTYCGTCGKRIRKAVER